MSDTTFLEYLDDKPQPAPERDKKAISPDNRFMSYIEEESPESLKASQNISAVRDIDPNTEAQHYDLSKKTGIPLSIVRNAPEQVREIDGKPVYTIDDPSLIQKYLGKNHTNAAISKDDIPGLEKVQKTFLEKVKESYRRGMHNVELGNLKANQLFGDTSEATERRIQEIKAEQAGGIPTDLKDLTVQRKKLSEIVAEKEALQPEGFVEKGILGAVEQAPIYLDTLSKGLERGLLGASVGAGTAVIAGQLGPQVATPEEIFTVPIFAGGGFGIGFKAGSAEAIFKLESGLAAVEFESFRDENGDPLDPGIIWSASIAVGLVNAGFEFASLSVLLKTIPGGEKLLSRFTGKEVSQVLKNPTVRKKLADIAVKYSKAVAFESLTEAAQEAVTIIGGELAKSAGEATGSGFFDKIDINDASKRVLESGIAAIGPTLIFGAPGSMVSVYNAISNVHDSNDFVANLDKDKTALDETLTAQRSKDHAKQIAETIGGRTEEVYISSEGIDKFFQTHTNEQAADILKKISVDPEKAREAVTTGEDISVKVSAILTLEQDEYDTLKDDIKPAPGAYTQREIQAQKANEDIENSINLLKEETEKSKQVDAEINRLQSEVQKAELPDPKLAEDAPILLKGLANRLSLEGIDPVEFLKKIKIKRGVFEGIKDFFQAKDDIKRGAIDILEDGRAIIKLYENADLSTVLHEVGHIALLEYSNLERSGQASTLLKQDMGIIRKWVGAKEGADLTRDQSEQFARGFEAYLMEGKAPTPELRTAFERFKQWLIQTYKTVKSLNVKLDRNVRGVFDRMLSANIEVEAAAAQNGFIIKTTDEMNVLGIRKEDQVYAKNLIDTATKKAERRLTQTRNKGIRQNRINWRAEAVSELKQENPVYGIIDDIIKSAGKGKYNVEELESIRRDIELSDAGFRMPKDDFYSEDWTGVDSTFPEYFKKINEAIKKKKEKGEKRKAPLSKSNTIGAFKKNAKGETYWRKGPIDKAIAGESLTEDQQAIVDMLVEGYRDQTARLIEAAGSEISPEFFATGDLRFDRKEFVERYGEDAIDRLPNKGIMINDGIPIDETALLYEYENSYEFINDLFSTPKFSEAVDQRVNEKQIAHDSQWRAEDFLVDLKEYRDYLDLIARYVNSQTVDQSTIEKSINTNIPRWRKEAQAEISNEAPDLTGDALEEAINTRVEEKTNAFRVRKAKPSAITTASLKRLAKETMNAKTVREAQRVDKFLAAAKKAASDGRRAILRKDWGEASRSSEIERFNYEMAGLAVKIRNEVTAAQNYAKKVGKPKKKETIGFEHKEAILHLISRYNLASLVPREPQSLPDYTSLFAGDDFGNQGFPDPEFLKNGGINDFRDLRIEQLRELDNAIHYLAGKGRIEKSEFLTDSEVSFEEVNNGAVSNLKKLKPLKKWEKGSMMRRLSDMTRSFFARLDGLTFIAKSVDGYTNLGKDGVKGPMEIYIIDRIKRKMNERDIRKGEITAQFEPHLKQIQKTNRKWRKRFGSYIKIEGVPLPQRLIDDGQTKGWKDYQIWGVILNAGNIGEKSNMENLLSGYPDLTPGMIETMKNLLSIEDMQAIQGIWDTIDTLFKDADAQFLKDNNYHMPKVEATPFIFKGETFRGGYYPISHDKNLSYKVADRGQIEDFFTQEAGKISVPYTKKNFTIQRQSGVALPIRLDLSGIDKHIRDTLNYIYLSDVIRDADKITRNEEFRDAVTRVLGKDVYDAIRPALQHIANPVKEGLDQPGSQLIERMRGLATLYNLAWNTGVAIKQPLSTFGAIRDMGFVPYLKGMGSVLGSPPAHYQQMIELSVYMKERMSFFDRELRSQFLKLTAEQKGIYFGDSKITWEDVKYFGFWQIRLADTITVLPIWHGAFQDKLLADQSNLQEAIEYADDIVRNSQPSAQPLDLSSWQRDGGAIRLLSMFQTFTVGKYGQRQRLFYRAWKNGAISTQQYAWFNFMDGIAPLIALNMVQSLLWGRDFDEETLEEIVKNVLAGWATMGIPIAGNIARSMTTGYGDAFDSPILETGNKLLNDGFKGIKGMAFFKNEKEREKALWAIAHTISILSGVPLDKIVAKAQKGAKQKKGVPVIKYLVPAPKKRR